MLICYQVCVLLLLLYLKKNLNFITSTTTHQATTSSNGRRAGVSNGKRPGERRRGRGVSGVRGVWEGRSSPLAQSGCFFSQKGYDVGLQRRVRSGHSSCDPTQSVVSGTIGLFPQGACDHGEGGGPPGPAPVPAFSLPPMPRRLQPVLLKDGELARASRVKLNLSNAQSTRAKNKTQSLSKMLSKCQRHAGLEKWSPVSSYF